MTNCQAGANVVVNGGGTFDLNGHVAKASTASGFGLVTNTAAATTSTITVGEAGADAAFGAGALQDGYGVLALRRSEAAFVTLSGSNSYTGGTTISRNPGDRRWRDHRLDRG